ncbi:MAG: class I SAM-dependent methyltransferase [Lentimicrobiaceae bacterium]|jgi:hypothetical protein
MSQSKKHTDLYKIEPIVTFNDVRQGMEEFWITPKNGNKFRLGIWDYDTMYKNPFLYDIIYNDIVKLDAPKGLTGYFLELMHQHDPKTKLRILDLAAGSGLSAIQLKNSGKIELIIGVDILESAREAAFRDHPGVYDDYYVLNFETLSIKQINNFKEYKFNCFFVTSGTGGGDDDSDYNDVMLKAYIQAIELMEPNSYIVFNIREKHTSGQELILNYLDSCCNCVGKKITVFRQLINGVKFNAEYVVMQLKK